MQERYEMEIKICSKCNIEKPVSEFQFRKDTGKYRNICINCNYLQRKAYKDKYYQEHKEEYKKYRENRKEYLKEYFKLNYENKRTIKLEKKRKFYKENKERYQKYQQEHKEERNEHKKLHYKLNYKNGTIFKLKQQYRNVILKAFKRFGYTKNTRAYEILGCDYEIFMNHLKETFKQNYGYEWDEIEPVHIDHIIPLATIKNEDDLLKLNHYTNLQLLKEKDNLEKSDKLDWKLK